MAFSKKQRITAVCLLVMAAMLLYPPWFWQGDPDEGISSGSSVPATRGCGNCPLAHPEYRWNTVIWWDRLLDQWAIVAVGMVLLLLLREARERSSMA